MRGAKTAWAVRMAVARNILLLASLAASLALGFGCDASVGPDRGMSPPADAKTNPPADPPNILFVVWDAVRADYLSLYGSELPTTPRLDEWSRQARVFEDCISVGSTTVPAHVSMFTGLLPTEHGGTNVSPPLSDSLQTLAELLKSVGYNTYMFSENPQVSARNNVAQGFDLAEHPWSPQYRSELRRLARERMRSDDRGADQARTPKIVVQKCVLDWLAKLDNERPFLIFLNYMAAHYRPTPPHECRLQVMTPAQVEASYHVDHSIETFWSYVFRLHEYTAEEIELTRLTYAAAVFELDGLFHELLGALAAGGYLDNTVVILTSDHGEHLGEHHLLDHQYSVYEPLMRVPLVLYDPARVSPGRDRRPVTNMDLFPTLLELVGIESPVASKAVSLLHPPDRRVRLGEYAGILTKRLARMKQSHPAFDPSPWNRSLRAYYGEPYKFIEASDGRHELYRLDADPEELQNLFEAEPMIAQRLHAGLREYLGTLQKPPAGAAPQPSPVDREHLRRLRAIGYLDEEGREASPDDQADERDPP